jgi:hypothetical protein
VNKPPDLARPPEDHGRTAGLRFPGLASKIEFNDQGDAVRDVYVVKAHNGQWVLATNSHTQAR